MRRAIWGLAASPTVAPTGGGDRVVANPAIGNHKLGPVLDESPKTGKLIASKYSRPLQ